ncbi:MAG TPA: bifunctional diguanylate cyclase/phosphodiesterase [Herpetosiphonaceae bacterium]
MRSPAAHVSLTPMRTRVWWYYLVLGIVAAAGYVWLTSLAALNLYYVVLAGTNIAAICVGMRLHRPPLRLPWYLFLLAQILTSLGNAAWTYYELVLGIESPFPSLADALYLVGYLSLIAGMLLLVHRRMRREDRGSVIDATIVAVSIGILGWVYLMEPYTRNPALTLAEQFVSMAYPLLDICLVAIIVNLLLSPGPHPRSYIFLAWSFSLILLTDVVYAIMQLNRTYATGSIVDFGWLLAYVGFGVAALHPSMHSLAEPAPTPKVKITRQRFVLLAAASLLGPTVLAVEIARGRPIWVPVIVGGSAVLFLLALARMHNLVQILKATMEQLETTLSSLKIAVQNYQQVEALLSHQAFHDSLTNLPNRALFKDRLQRALAHTQRHQQSLAVLFLDLDEFKYINDRFGHKTGDALLIMMSERLQASLRAEDTAARLGGDEFTVLLEELPDIHGAVMVAERIIGELDKPFVVGDQTFFVTASIGITWSATGQEHADELLRQADVAMYRAKSLGKARYALYDPEMNARALERLDFEAELRRAIEAHEFHLCYQPKVDLATGQIVGVEALTRWQHPQRGTIPPGIFIPLAEETRLILPLGRWVLEQACHQARIWHDLRPAGPPLTISVNLSACQFQHPALVAEIDQILRATALPAHLLALEITESMVMEHVDTAIATLRELKELGIQIWIDDFGTGYSSLSYLKCFPVDTLKIDKSFVDGLGRSAEDTAIVRAVITLAHTLGMTVIAEGIETFEQATQLRILGCEVGQGYYFARPVPAAEIEALIAEDPPLSASLPNSIEYAG